MKLPIFIPITDIMACLGWNYHWTRKWLKQNDALIKHGGRIGTTIPALRKAFPDTYDGVMEELAERLLETSESK